MASRKNKVLKIDFVTATRLRRALTLAKTLTFKRIRQQTLMYFDKKLRG